MRGAKGGFWDRLFLRIRRLRLKIKLKKEKEKKSKEKKQKKEELIKKQRQEEFIYYSKKRKKYKGINSEKNIKIAVKKEKLQQLKNIEMKPKLNTTTQSVKNIIPKMILATPVFLLSLPKKNVSLKKQESRKNTNIKKKKQSVKTSNTVKQKTVRKNKKYVGIGTNVVSQIKTKENEKLIKEIKKLIESDKEKIKIFTEKVHELENTVNYSTSNDELNKIQEQLLNIKKEIERILKNYEILKYGNNLKELNIPKITELINEIKNINDINEIINKCNIYLDYYNELSNLRLNEQQLEYKTEEQKEVVDGKNSTVRHENIKMQNLNKIEKRLSNELEKQKEILNHFNKLINEIEPEKIERVQSNYINNFLHKIGGLFTTFLSLPFLKKPKNIPTFAFGLYMLNNSIKSMRGIVTKNTIINYIPSNDYARAIIANRSDLNYIDYMLDDSLFQIRCLKEEYELNFSSFYGNEQFNKQFEKIEAIELKLLRQSKEIKNIRNKYEQVLNKNNKKIMKIKELSNR